MRWSKWESDIRKALNKARDAVALNQKTYIGMLVHSLGTARETYEQNQNNNTLQAYKDAENDLLRARRRVELLKYELE